MSHFANLLDLSFSLLLNFLPVLGLETSVCSCFVLFFWGHIEYKMVFSVTKPRERGNATIVIFVMSLEPNKGKIDSPLKWDGSLTELNILENKVDKIMTGPHIKYFRAGASARASVNCHFR